MKGSVPPNRLAMGETCERADSGWHPPDGNTFRTVFGLRQGRLHQDYSVGAAIVFGVQVGDYTHRAHFTRTVRWKLQPD